MTPALFAHIFYPEVGLRSVPRTDRISALPCGETVTAPQRPGLRIHSVNARGGEVEDLTKPGNVTTPFFLEPERGRRGVAPFAGLRHRMRLLSRRIRDAFAAQPADDPAGDYPPASDCWPMAALNDESSVRHAPDYVAGPTLLSPGKSHRFTGRARSHVGGPA